MSRRRSSRGQLRWPGNRADVNAVGQSSSRHRVGHNRLHFYAREVKRVREQRPWRLGSTAPEQRRSAVAPSNLAAPDMACGQRWRSTTSMAAGGSGDPRRAWRRPWPVSGGGDPRRARRPAAGGGRGLWAAVEIHDGHGRLRWRLGRAIASRLERVEEGLGD